MIYVIFAAVFLLTGFLVIRNMGKYLVFSQKPEKSDLIVVLLGPIPDRALQAFDLYNAGYAGKILFANEFQYGADKLKPFGIELENTSSILKRTLIKLGTAEEDVIILKKITASTQEEAQAVAEYVQLHEEIRSILLVTSSYHSRRTFKIFSKALKGADREITVISSPSIYTDFNQYRWWNDRDSAKMVFLEYLKLMNYYLIEQFKL
ncbi:MAG: YdcF family protein [Lentimicrobium sp.]|nr:YdcF family protein [Lentimicrobium sp.]